MKKTYRQTPNGLVRVDQLPRRERKTPYIIGDMKPYRAVTGDAQGKMITSRSAHRAFLQRNNLVEVGNEYEYMTRHGGMSEDNPNIGLDTDPQAHEDRICRNLTDNLNKQYR